MVAKKIVKTARKQSLVARKTDLLYLEISVMSTEISRKI